MRPGWLVAWRAALPLQPPLPLQTCRERGSRAGRLGQAGRAVGQPRSQVGGAGATWTGHLSALIRWQSSPGLVGIVPAHAITALLACREPQQG